MTSSRPFAVPGIASKAPIRLVETSAFRLALAYTLVFTLALAAFAGVSYWLTAHNLLRQINLRLTDQMTSLIADYPAFVANPGLLTSSTNRYWYWITQPDGKSYGTPLPIKPAEARFQHFKIADTLEPGAKPDGTGRALVKKLANGTTLVVGDDISDEDELLENLFAAFYILPGLTLLTGLGCGLIASLGALRRLRRITGTADAIMQGDLSRRIPHGNSRNELDRLAATLNEMLVRVTSLMASLQQVSNDIAHDLRTPLSHLRQKLEQVQTSKLLPAENLVEDVDRLLNTFDALLRLAKIEAGGRQEKFTTVDLKLLLEELTATYEPLWSERRQVVRLDLADVPGIRGDASLLKQLGANLFENTLTHAPAGSAVQISLRQQADKVVWITADTGPGIPVAERTNVLERFYRLDRSRGTPGNGLGLSLVAAITQLHQGQLQLAESGIDAANPGLCVTVSLPITA